GGRGRRAGRGPDLDRAGQPPHDPRARPHRDPDPAHQRPAGALGSPRGRSALPIGRRDLWPGGARSGPHGDGTRRVPGMRADPRLGRRRSRAGRGIERRLGHAGHRGPLGSRGQDRAPRRDRGRDRPSRVHRDTAQGAGRVAATALTRPSPPGGGVPPQGCAYVQGLLLRRPGTVLEAGKEYVVEARLHGLALGEGFRSVSALLEGLQTEEASGSLHGKVTEAMLNGETSFFRDLYPFEALRDVLLPEIIAKREATRLLHIWCAAAASGQEAYSVAMLLLEHFPQLAGWRIRLIASDVSKTMLARAQAGVFNQIE